MATDPAQPTEPSGIPIAKSRVHGRTLSPNCSRGNARITGRFISTDSGRVRCCVVHGGDAASRSRRRRLHQELAPLVLVIVVSISFFAPAAPLALKQLPRTCDYATGRWVPAPYNFPRYSGVASTSRHHCKYMRALWNCDGTGRPDKIYRSYRWQPEGCNLTYINPYGFMKLMRNKRLLMVGDSIMGNMYESLLCLITSSPFRHRKVSYRTPTGARFRGFSFPGFQFEIHYYFLPHLMRSSKGYNEGGKKGNHGYNVDLDVFDPDLANVIPAYDGIIFHSMAWWMRNVPGRTKGNNYFRGGQPVEVSDTKAYQEAMHNLGQHLKNINYPGVPYFVSASPKHYNPPRNSTKLGSCGATSVVQNNAAQQYPSTHETEAFYAKQKLSLTGTGSPMRLLRVTRLSAVRPDGHLGLWSDVIAKNPNFADMQKRMEEWPGDCTHWCLPGVPDAWVDLYYTNALLEPTFWKLANAPGAPAVGGGKGNGTKGGEKERPSQGGAGGSGGGSGGSGGGGVNGTAGKPPLVKPPIPGNSPGDPPSTINPPATSPPVVKPPVVKPPVVKPPGVKPPGVKPPAAKPPVVKQPIVKPPAVKPPTANPPVVKPPVAKPPVANTPAAKAPAVKPPAVTPPAVKPPVVKPPAAKAPAVKPPAVTPPAVKPPVVKPPVVKPPAAKAPAVKLPAVKPPAAKVPAAKPPTVKQPGVKPPLVHPPATTPVGKTPTVPTTGAPVGQKAPGAAPAVPKPPLKAPGAAPAVPKPPLKAPGAAPAVPAPASGKGPVLGLPGGVASPGIVKAPGGKIGSVGRWEGGAVEAGAAGRTGGQKGAPGRVPGGVSSNRTATRVVNSPWVIYTTRSW